MLMVSEIKQAVLDITKHYPIKKIFLFGSYADETSTEYSDAIIQVTRLVNIYGE